MQARRLRGAEAGVGITARLAAARAFHRAEQRGQLPSCTTRTLGTFDDFFATKSFSLRRSKKEFCHEMLNIPRAARTDGHNIQQYMYM